MAKPKSGELRAPLNIGECQDLLRKAGYEPQDIKGTKRNPPHIRWVHPDGSWENLSKGARSKTVSPGTAASVVAACKSRLSQTGD